MEKKNIHDGHRVRLINTVNNVGLDGLSDIQALEYILFFIFPRGDVNPLAHRLLDRFGCLPYILEASVEDLMEVKGMGETSAMKLHSLLEIYNYYLNKKMEKINIPSSIAGFSAYLESLLRWKTQEEVYIFGLNPKGEITQGRKFSKGTGSMVVLDMTKVALYLSSHKVSSAFVVHNHPQGKAAPSHDDLVTYERLKGVFLMAGCRLLDSFIVGDDGVFSMENSKIVRKFSEE